jgi:hypothetical protein
LDLKVKCKCGTEFPSDEAFMKHWELGHKGEEYEPPIRELIMTRVRCSACPSFEKKGEKILSDYFRPFGSCKKTGKDIEFGDELRYCSSYG